MSSLTARIGSMLSPLLVDLAPNPVLPLLVFGALAAIAGNRFCCFYYLEHKYIDSMGIG